MKIKLAIASGFAVLALAGCTVSAPPAPTVTVTAAPETTAPAPAPVPQAPTGEEVFIQTIENKYGPLTYSQEQELISFAKKTCRNFDNYGVNATLNQYAQEVSSNREAKMLGYVVGAGVATWCPEYANAFTSGTSA